MIKDYFYSPNLLITPYGGVDSVTKNMFVYQYGPDILVVDCGIGFPDEPAPENQLLIPDLSYLLKNKDRIRGLVVTHAHFDHYGAIPHLLLKANIPLFATRLTAQFIIKKAEESGIKPNQIDFRLISDKDEEIKISPFKLAPFHINHSIPETLGFLIKTPAGNIFHVADFKFDWTPVDERPFDIQKASRLAATKKPVLLLSDCLGAVKSGHTHSEKTIQEVFENLMIRAQRLVVVTTVSSNISRIKQAIQASANVGRKTAFLGRSVEQSAEIAKSLGYFSSLKNHLLPTKKIKGFPLNRLTLVVAGSYGQTDSALVKISQNKHRLVKLKKEDLVIFSADPAPPQVLLEVNNTIDNLTKLGARVYYYEIQDNLHVSGHGTAEDVKMLIALIRPQYLAPIGGDYRHMAAYALLAKEMGYSEKQTLLLKEKQTIAINLQGQLVVK